VLRIRTLMVPLSVSGWTAGEDWEYLLGKATGGGAEERRSGEAEERLGRRGIILDLPQVTLVYFRNYWRRRMASPGVSVPPETFAVHGRCRRSLSPGLVTDAGFRIA
jgi:hypothetical protein